MTTETGTLADQLTSAPGAMRAAELVPLVVVTQPGRHTRMRSLLLPALLTALVIATGMAYSLWWAAVVRHNPHYWVIPGDFWSTFRQAHFVALRIISDIYRTGSPLVTLPGYAVLLAPVAAFSSALGLPESAPQVFLQKPDAWLVAGPFVLLTAGVALIAFDALARRLGVTGSRRVMLLPRRVGGHLASVDVMGSPRRRPRCRRGCPWPSPRPPIRSGSRPAGSWVGPSLSNFCPG